MQAALSELLKPSPAMAHFYRPQALIGCRGKWIPDGYMTRAAPLPLYFGIRAPFNGLVRFAQFVMKDLTQKESARISGLSLYAGARLLDETGMRYRFHAERLADVIRRSTLEADVRRMAWEYETLMGV
jgi:hypothetical protein